MNRLTESTLKASPPSFHTEFYTTVLVSAVTYIKKKTFFASSKNSKSTPVLKQFYHISAIRKVTELVKERGTVSKRHGLRTNGTRQHLLPSALVNKLFQFEGTSIDHLAQLPDHKLQHVIHSTT